VQALRFAVDTGGTFTDLVLEDGDGRLRLYKAPTTPDDPIDGVLDVLRAAAADRGDDLAALLGRGELFVHGTTRAINAILTRGAARTAFVTTAGHPDVLLFREGGRLHPFDNTREYPAPYVPRALTFEVPERIGSAGEVVAALDEDAVVEACARMRELRVEAVGVCLLWSIVNPAHELRVGELLAEHLPGVPCTLSHALNPALREYRRASSACIDASLKPLMTSYLRGLERRLGEAGFRGRTLVVTSGGGVLDAAAVAEAPIHSIGSGPAMAPVAGRHYALTCAGAETAVVADTGGTSYDVSLVRRGRIPWTRETWLGGQFVGHITGFPSVDVRSIGAGGGSIAWVDDGGLLHVGPQSAGSVPGPACYGRGGAHATVTDASLVLGYLDPAYFLGGAMALDVLAAHDAVARDVAAPLGLDQHDAGAAVLKLATERMVGAIEEITLHQGIDPRDAVLVGGGGAAGLNAVAIARRLGCPRIVIPDVGAALSAAGALMSELTADYATPLHTTSERFDAERVNAALAGLEARCRAFADGPGAGAAATVVELSAEARYPHQIWELEVALPATRFHGAADVEALRQAFHATHQEVFAIADLESGIEILAWRARVRCRLREAPPGRAGAGTAAADGTRMAYFADAGLLATAVRQFESLDVGAVVAGPAIVESPVTTVVVEPGATASRTAAGSLAIDPGVGAPLAAGSRAEVAG
jgi:N-methylhydantoinase A